MTQADDHLVIMAGGVGGRFWPMSTAGCPKQFIDVLGVGRSPIQLIYSRFAGVAPSDNMWVVTNQRYVSLIHEQLPEILLNHILSESRRHNTTPCIAYMNWRIKEENPKANIVVSPSDHIMVNETEFRRVISSRLKFTAEVDVVVTLGVKPTRPETGYDYIQADLSTASIRSHEIYRVDQFREKPDLPAAEQYIRQSNFFWNAGISIRGASTTVNAFRIYQPSIAGTFERIIDVLDTVDEQRVIDEVCPEYRDISVDYAIMEKAEEVFVRPTDLGWSDLGVWGSSLTQTQHDTYGNAVIGSSVHLFDSKSYIVHTAEECRVVIQGLDGYIVAGQDGKLLICCLSEEQRLKQLTGKGQVYPIRIRKSKACIGTCSMNEIYAYLFYNKRAM